MAASSPLRRGSRARAAGDRGFTLVELLVVIAIVAVAVSLLIPAVQAPRLHWASQASARTVAALLGAAERYAAETGQFPPSLDAIGEFCAGTCPVPPDVFTYGAYNGHAFQIITAGRDGPYAVEAEPLFPGVTGILTCTARAGRPVGCSPTPGSELGQRRMLDAVLGEAARLGGGLFVVGAPSLGPRILSFLEAGGVDEALFLLDRNGDGSVSLADLYDFPGGFAQRFDGITPLLEPPLRGFLQAVAGHMRLDTLDPLAAGAIGVGQADLAGDATDPLYGFAGWCRLTRLWVTDAKVADQLCGILDTAAAADARGDARAAARHLARFRQRLDDQVHRTVTRDRARLIGALLDVRAGR